MEEWTDWHETNASRIEIVPGIDCCTLNEPAYPPKRGRAVSHPAPAAITTEPLENHDDRRRR